MEIGIAQVCDQTIIGLVSVVLNRERVGLSASESSFFPRTLPHAIIIFAKHISGSREGAKFLLHSSGTMGKAPLIIIAHNCPISFLFLRTNEFPVAEYLKIVMFSYPTITPPQYSQIV